MRTVGGLVGHRSNGHPFVAVTTSDGNDLTQEGVETPPSCVTTNIEASDIRVVSIYQLPLWEKPRVPIDDVVAAVRRRLPERRILDADVRLVGVDKETSAYLLGVAGVVSGYDTLPEAQAYLLRCIREAIQDFAPARERNAHANRYEDQR